MAEMLERVAKALYDADDSDAPRFGWGSDTHLHGRYRDLAREAIAAMREPTPRSLKAGASVHWGTDAGDAAGSSEADEAENSRQIWQAMIAAALA